MAASSEGTAPEPAAVGGASGGPALSQGAVRNGRSPRDTEPPGAPPPLGDDPGRRGDGNVIAVGDAAEKREGERKSEEEEEQTPPGSSRERREAGTMTNPAEEAPSWAAERREVGVQVVVEVCDRGANTTLCLLPGPDTHTHTHPHPANGLLRSGDDDSALIGLPIRRSQQEAGPDKQRGPPLVCIPIGLPPFQHVCQIDIELCGQSELGERQPMERERRAGRAHPVPGLDKEPAPEEVEKEEEEEEEEVQEKIQEVVWDEQGMTWEVYGAAVDMESLGVAIQSHLQRKIREQEKRIGTLRKSISSEASPGRRRRRRRRRKRRSVFRCVFRPGCCRTPPPSAAAAD